MKKATSVGDLFRTHPTHWWGYRGDPFLWEDMAGHLADLRLPSTYSELAIILEKSFEELTGKQLSDTEDVHLDRYAHGGMSSGLISIGFWRSKAFPLLFRRFAATLDPQNQLPTH